MTSRGGKLKIEDLRKARKEEVGYMTNRGIWEVVPIKMCWEGTGTKPLGVRWVDTNKGTEVNPDVRCRLVAGDFKRTKRIMIGRTCSRLRRQPKRKECR